MELIALIVMAFLLPIMTIMAFIIGYNLNAPQKILKPKRKKKKEEHSEDEKMIERIDNAKVI
jgi:hypothetical protein